MEGGMSGIVFFKTNRLDDLKKFYIDRIGCDLWMEQADCALFRQGNFIFGFCEREEVDTGGIITFFYETREAVDRRYAVLGDIASARPKFNDKYDIYHFFATDPEGRMVEFQSFDDHIDSHLMADELMRTRRSIRKFDPAAPPSGILDKLFELCRFAPTSMNTQSYYFKIINDRSMLEKLAHVREKGSLPIGNAPMAVAICSDPGLSRRHIQDGCIAAYHFLLAAWSLGLGTCWIAAMDRDEVKEILKIPSDHYIATITPLGYPIRKDKEAPERHEAAWFLR
jgi:nitroreductase